MPRYQKVLWHYDLPDEPVALYSEIDSGFEVRKVEVTGMAGMTMPTDRARREHACWARR
jgi:hypothetical protein